MQQKKTASSTKSSTLFSIKLTGEVFKSEMQLWHRKGLVDYFLRGKILAILRVIIMYNENL